MRWRSLLITGIALLVPVAIVLGVCIGVPQYGAWQLRREQDAVQRDLTVLAERHASRAEVEKALARHGIALSAQSSEGVTKDGHSPQWFTTCYVQVTLVFDPDSRLTWFTVGEYCQSL